MYLDGGSNKVQIYEKGSKKSDHPNFFTTDVFSVERNGNTIIYLKNGTVFYTSETKITDALHLETAFLQNGAKLTNILMSNTNEAMEITFNDNAIQDSVNAISNAVTYQGASQEVTLSVTDAQGQSNTPSSNITTTTPSSSLNMPTTVTDSVDVQSLSNMIVGTSGVDTITGTSGNDIITANEGDDTLTGNGGVDTFDYNSVADGNDTISDFVIGHGSDKLDLSDLLKGETSTTLANFIKVTDSNATAAGGDITLKIDADGGASFADSDITITLTGAGITGAETTLASLITDNIVIS